MAPSPSPPMAAVHSASASPAFFRALESKVAELSMEFATQASRVNMLEHGAEVSVVAVAALQAKEREFLQLLCEQQQELEELRLQQQRFKDIISLLALQQPPQLSSGVSNALSGSSRGIVGPGELSPAAMVSAGAAQPKELQQHPDLPQELRRLQQTRSFGNNITPMEAAEVLQELKEERGFVTEMLNNVKKEKCEVIATMHSFVLDKSEAMEELEGFRRATRDEFTAAFRANSQIAMHSRRSHVETNKVSTPVLAVAVEHCEDGIPQHQQQPQQPQIQQHQHPQTQALTFTGRQASRPSLCPGVPHLTLAEVMPSVAVHATQSGPLPLTKMQQDSNILTHGESTACRGQSPAPPRASMSPRTLRGCSPTRQLSSAGGLLTQGNCPYAGDQRGFLPISVACSPALVTRPTVAELRSSAMVNMGGQQTMGNAFDPKKSPVRRFVSAGVSPRCHDGSIPANWAPMSLSQTTLMR